MPRIRSIHYDACKSDKLDQASAEAERCYWRLQPFCDDDGRAEDDPRFLRSQMFPISESVSAVLVDDWLAELDLLGLIVRYEVDGRRYLEVSRWSDYQKPQKKIESKLPPVPEDYATIPVVVPEEFGEVSLGEGVGEGGNGATAPPPPKGPHLCPNPFVIDEPLRKWAQTKTPAVDLDELAESMLQWSRGNGKRKSDWRMTLQRWAREEQKKHPAPSRGVLVLPPSEAPMCESCLRSVLACTCDHRETA